MSCPGPYEERTDNGGNRFYLGDIGGLLLPAFPTVTDFPQHGRDVRELQMYPNDVICAGFPKSGNHWVLSVIHMLVRGHVDSYFSPGLGAMLDRTPMGQGHIAPPLGHAPRILYTHFTHDFMPRQVWEKRVKVVYLQRNPKDAWVSLYNQVTGHLGSLAYDGTWAHFFTLMMTSGFWYGNWFDYAMDWDRHLQEEKARGHPIFINEYEAMSKNTVGQIEKLDVFLGTNRGRQLCQQIADKCHINVMKEANKSNRKGDKIFKENAVGFYRKGEVGDWKNWFTVAQNEQFDREFNARMEGSALHYTFQ